MPMSDEPAVVEDYVQAPAAAAMFVLADRAGYDAAALADPATVSALAASAVGALTPWNGAEPAAEVRARMLRLVRPLRPLVAAVVTDRRNDWWRAPLDRSAQLLVTEREIDPTRLSPSAGRNTPWETYAQRSLRGLWTSTELPVAAEEELRSGRTPSWPAVGVTGHRTSRCTRHGCTSCRQHACTRSAPRATGTPSLYASGRRKTRRVRTRVFSTPVGSTTVPRPRGAGWPRSGTPCT